MLKKGIFNNNYIMQNVLINLQCPIAHDFFEDPVTIPNCGHTFNREHLGLHFNTMNMTCPTCKQDVGDFDVNTAPKNFVIAGLVDSYLNKSDNTEQKWTATLIPLNDIKHNRLPIGQLKVCLENSSFVPRKSLFIAVVDKSGSMGGSPWNQVQTAMLHIASVTHSSELVETVFITYASFAYILETKYVPPDEIRNKIKALYAGGGTNFKGAFEKVKDVLGNYIHSNDPAMQYVDNNVSNITIVFLTDGQDSTLWSAQNKEDAKNTLVSDFKEMLADKWNGPLSVHTVGFSNSCDKELLEMMRLCGNIEGTFRYAEHNDGDEMLCQKLQALFDIASKSSTVQIKMELEKSKFLVGSKYFNELDVQFPISKNKKGEYCQWVHISDYDNIGTLTINSHMDNNVELQISVNNDNNVKTKSVFQKWLAKLIDDLASELMDLAKIPKQDRNNAFDLHCALIEQRINAISVSAEKNHLQERLNFLLSQVQALRSGGDVNSGKLGDMRFASQFATIKSSTSQKPNPVLPTTEKLKIKAEPELKEEPVRYNFNPEIGNKNILQKNIAMMRTNKISENFQQDLDASTIDDILHKDVNGNNTIHVAAICGQNLIMKYILDKYPNLDVNLENNNNETPMTLAIKKQGFWKVMKVLLAAGGEIPTHRKESLEQYAINYGYEITGKMLSGMGAGVAKTVNKTMTAEYVEFVYETAMENNTQIDAQIYLDVAMSKCMIKLVKELIKKHNAVPTFDMLVDYCLPSKPDHPEVDKYLELTKIVANSSPTIIHQKTANDENILFKACESGNLPHVEYFINKGVTIDEPNDMGNTPLWVSCAKRYPCIIEELINRGADVNFTNKRGNPPLYSICQKGPKKVAETLLSFGATVDHKNDNGDTLILICCRNGQHEILEQLLNYVDMDFVNFKAHIDGFNAILASAEADKPECIRVLHEYGVNLNQKTDDDNEILAGATPLHIAAYYNRLGAAQMLLSLGCDKDIVDINKQTPLHIAVIQGNIPLIKLLVNSGANVNLKDSSGNIPASYCRNRHEIRKVLVNPALDVLMCLAKDGFTKTEEQEAYNILKQHTGVLGCLETKDAIDLTGHDGSTPLMQAIIHSKYDLVNVFRQLNADPNMKNNMNLNCFLWMNWINNPRIKQLLYDCKNNSESVTKQQLDVIMNTKKNNPSDAPLLFLGNKPKDPVILLASGIDQRMEQFANNVIGPKIDNQNDIIDSDTHNNDNYNNDNMSLINLLHKTKLENNDTNYDGLMWNAKVFIVNLIASGNNILTPQQILAVTLYTNNSIIPSIINKCILANNLLEWNTYVKCMNMALDSIMPFKGEVYFGVNNVDRSLYKIGTEFTRPTYLSTSAMWRVAVDHLDFADKKKGTVFIVKSKTGRHVGQFSQFSYDSEVIFKPNTKFKVHNWYRGDVICLGQENIREHTFKIKEEDIGTMEHSNKSMIIELHEM